MLIKSTNYQAILQGGQSLGIEGHQNSEAYILGPLFVVKFWDNTGEDEEIPYLDFLAILQEWIDYLEALSFNHYLSNK